MSDDKPKKTITQEQYLMAFALFTMARHHYAEEQRFTKRMLALLGHDDGQGYGGWLSDAVIQDDKTFDQALALEGFVVAPETAP